MTEPTSSSVAPRVDAIQSLRAVAVLLVLATHVIVAVIDHGGGAGAFFPAMPNLARIGYSGVDLFFVISGFVMAHTLAEPRTVRQFAASRFIRIWPLYALATLAVLPLADPARFELRTLVTSVTLLPLADGAGYHGPLLTVGWTLGVEAMFYLLVGLTIAARRGAGTLLILALLAASAGLLAMPGWAPLRMLASPLMAEFAAGVAVWLAWRARLGVARKLAIALGLMILWAEVTQLLPIGVAMDPALSAAGQGGLSRSLAWGLPWALVVYGVVTSSGCAARRPTMVQTIGDASYSIYLVHLTMIQAMLAAGPAVSPESAHAWIAALIAVPLAGGLVVHHLVERPLLRGLRALAKRSRSLDRAPQPILARA